MNLTTFTSRAAAALVAAVAGFASYRHIVDVADGAGEPRDVALALPLAIDGLIVIATLAMVEDKRAGRHPRVSARLALGFGVVATLAANIASAQPTWTARAVAAVPAVSFLIAVEVLARSGRPVASTLEPPPVEPMREPVVDPWRYAEPLPGEPAHEPPAEPRREPPRAPSRKRVKARSLTAAERVTAAHTRHPDATHEQLAKRLGLSASTVKRHRPPTGSPSGPDAAETAVVDQVNGAESDLVEVTP